MVGRAPHRLVVEHVHGRAVERRGRDHIQAKAIADGSGLRLAALLPVMLGQDLDGFFLGAGDGYGNGIEHEPARGGNRRLT